MQDTQESEWGIIEASVAGATHEHNQDAKQTYQDPSYSLLAVADGHGSKAYTHSARGAQLAVESAIDAIQYRLNQLSPFKNVSKTKITYRLDLLPITIVEQWRKKVGEDARTDPVLAKIDQRDYPFKPYGTTLLTISVTSSFIFYSQIGDGDILVVTEDGHVSKPVPEDRRHFANETTSLSTMHAENDFHTTLHWLDGEQDKNPTPALIMLATDGYRNSFNSEADFFKVATDILNILKQPGGDKHVQEQLEGWLQATTEQGSGDDITVVLLWNKRLLQLNRHEEPGEDTILTPEDEKLLPLDSEAENIQKQPQMEKTNPGSDKVQTAISSDKLLLSRAFFQKTSHDTGASIRSLLHLVVSKEPDRGHYTSITEALQAASDGDTIVIHRGLYEERLHIQRSVRIEAIEPGAVSIISPVPCISCQAPDIRIKGLRIRGQSEKEIQDQPAIALGTGHAEFLECVISSDSQLTIGVSDQKSSSLFSECTIYGSNAIGFLLEQAAQCEVKQCAFLDNRGKAITLDEASELQCSDSIFSNSGDCGLVVGKDCFLLMEGCHIHNQSADGIRLKANADAYLNDCNIQSGQNIGLSLVKSICRIQGGEISNNQKHAIQLKDGSELHGMKVKIRHPQDSTPALIALGQSHLHLQQCDLSGLNPECCDKDTDSEIIF